MNIKIYCGNKKSIVDATNKNVPPEKYQQIMMEIKVYLFVFFNSLWKGLKNFWHLKYRKNKLQK